MICITVLNLWFQSTPMARYHVLQMENQLIRTQHENYLSSLRTVQSNMSTLNNTLFNETICCNNFINETEYNKTEPSYSRITTVRILESPVSAWSIAIDYITLLWFLFDFSVRFTCSPDKYLYFLAFDNVVDFITTLSLFFDLVMNFYVTDFHLHR